MSNSQNSHQMWWTKEKRDHLPARIRAIQRTNDPTTFADEVLTIARFATPVLLVATGLLGAMNYFRFFSMSFSVEVALILAGILTFIIEVGKLKGALWALRIPMFHGFRHIGYSPANTISWLGLFLLATACFIMSITNSTKGGQQLALLMAQEKNDQPFVSDTKAIDEQIALLHQANTNAPTVKWKGKTYWQDAKSVRANANSIESLQRQRESAVAQQRADWEKKTATTEGHTNWAAKLVMASGGWIELIQFILILIAVVCERLLGGKIAYQQSNTDQNIPSKQPATAAIGFNMTTDGNVRSTDNQKPVTQLQQDVSQVNGGATSISPAEALRWFETELRREPSNLQNKHASNETVIKRIHTKLSRAEAYIDQVEKIPSEAGWRFSNYLERELFPVIEPDNSYPTAWRIIDVLHKKMG